MRRPGGLAVYVAMIGVDPDSEGAGTDTLADLVDAFVTFMTGSSPIARIYLQLAVGRGLSNAEIAKELYLSIPTVKAHVSRLFDKLGATNRVQIAITVHDAGLV
jgi:DNA-binding CsgD family transcriptional regulator